MAKQTTTTKLLLFHFMPVIYEDQGPWPIKMPKVISTSGCAQFIAITIQKLLCANYKYQTRVAD